MKLVNVFFLSMITIACKAQSLRNDGRPIDLHDGIKTGTMANVGINPDTIEKLTGKLNSGYYPNIHSLLIYKDGTLVYETYLTGEDENWGTSTGLTKHSINDLHDLRSITKSIVSACVGIAINQGKIKSTDQKIFDFFKEYAALDTGLKQQLTVGNLLNMTSGLRWNEDVPYNNPENSEIQMTKSDNPVKFILSQPIVIKPGTKWNYNGGAVQLLAYILEKATGKPLDQYANENLFIPLGIKSFYWHNFPGTKVAEAASGLRLRSRDALKFAIMYQQKGIWEGKQIVPAAWIEQSFNKSITISPELGYGYLFWKLYPPATYNVPDLTVSVGNGDERIFFDDKHKLIVLITAGNYNLPSNFFGKTNSLATLKDYIYPSFIK
jgi:CubicO group peptidase (beta-lactamase class C family)